MIEDVSLADSTDGASLDDATSDPPLDTPDAVWTRNESRVVCTFEEGLDQDVSARLLQDVRVPSTVDSRDGQCRTYNILELPETRAGTLTVRIGSAAHSILPDASRERFLYQGSFRSAATAGTRVQVDAQGSASFPPFSLFESIPRSVEITEPIARSELVWNPRTPIAIRWRRDGSTDSVQIILLGRVSPTESSFATVCTVPISDSEFVISPSMLQRYDALPQARRVDVYRIRAARGVFGNAPVALEIRNETQGRNWITFR
ncbi:MAG: hypothetical protein JNK05_17575 [Myxococcales bacterium]|nr:hypothetical protein [Myxococcales bacterium]